jgi:CRP-like cAMP-binding protein/Fe-S-cluster-containing hydrogenase component 2
LDSRETLAAKVEREVMACIGCHDCMLACPLPEARIVTIAELNAACEAPKINSPSVMKFVAACTQCRMCVPACPADLSRADMVLINKMKIEDAVPDHDFLLQIGPRVVASGYTLEGLAKQLTAVRLFSGVTSTDLRRLLLKTTLRKLAPGEILCREGEYHERLYLVLQGSLEQSSTAHGGGRLRILLLGPGSFFGEMAVLADQPEAFAVHALVSSIVLEVPKAAAHRLMSQAPAFAETMNALYQRRALFTYVRNAAALRALPTAALDALGKEARLVALAPGETLLREGTAPSDVFIVRTGFFRVKRHSHAGEVTLVYFREGDAFGALSLVLGESYVPFTVEAVAHAEVVRVPGRSLLAALTQHPDAQGPLLAAATEAEQVARSRAMDPSYHLAPVRAQPGAAAQTMMRALDVEALVQHGIATSKEVLVIDQRRCTYCQACVEACERRHGYSRLELSGLQLGHLMFPGACRHCEDPVCLLCSVNGIVRLPSGEITIVEENCIGCGACADRCPYGNIRMHPAEEPKQHGIWDGIMALLRGASREEPAAEDHRVQKRAVKCDLCAGHDDYACVTACPVGAAARMDPKDLLEGLQGPIGLVARAQRPT